MISLAEFDQIYQASVRAVFAHWTREMQERLAAHCYGWHPARFDFADYLQASSARFYRAYQRIAERAENPTGKLESVKSTTNESVSAVSDISICDVGGMWGVFPLTLARLGFEVTMTEALKYYGASFDALFETVAAGGVRIVDFDPFDENAAPLSKQFDFVSVMAVLEHYPHSLKTFMSRATELLKPRGALYLEVPNVAYFPKRLALLRGRTPLVPVADIYRSETPFIGHHHEFTIAELRELARLSGLRVVREDFYNYSLGDRIKARPFVRHPHWFLAFSLLKDSRECLAVVCERETV